MSFSSDVKNELSKHISSARHCQIAEIAAITAMCTEFIQSQEGKFSIKISTENESVIRKYFTLLKKTFNISSENIINHLESYKKGNTYSILINETESSKILQTLKMLDTNKIKRDELVDSLIIQQTCCKRTFIRGAFLASGSISAPEKFYHFEIVCESLPKAVQLQNIINTFDVDAKIIKRKKYFVVYIKEGTHIVDILNIMEAHVSLMELENVRILKEMRNSVNRQVNCETANLNKTVEAAVKQIRDIEFIRDTIGLSSLSPGLSEIAHVRLENPDMNLKDLGMLLSPPVGKSGVNHRLRKLSEMTEILRNTREDYQNDQKKY